MVEENSCWKCGKKISSFFCSWCATLQKQPTNKENTPLKDDSLLTQTIEQEPAKVESQESVQDTQQESANTSQENNDEKETTLSEKKTLNSFEKFQAGYKTNVTKTDQSEMDLQKKIDLNMNNIQPKKETKTNNTDMTSNFYIFEPKNIKYVIKDGMGCEVPDREGGIITITSTHGDVIHSIPIDSISGIKKKMFNKMEIRYKEKIDVIEKMESIDNEIADMDKLPVTNKKAQSKREEKKKQLLREKRIWKRTLMVILEMLENIQYHVKNQILIKFIDT